MLEDVGKDSDQKILIYEDSTEANEDSKSLLLAPYNSFTSLDFEKEDLEILNDICEFGTNAQLANEKYNRDFNSCFDNGRKNSIDKIKEVKNENKIKEDKKEEKKNEEKKLNNLSSMEDIYNRMLYYYYNYEYYGQLFEYYYYYYLYYYSYY